MTLSSDRTVFITGAAAGIGRATALAFAKNGYRVGAYDIDQTLLSELRDQAESDGWNLVTGQLDVTKPEDWVDQLTRFTAESGRLDVLINNAGVLTAGRFDGIGIDKHVRMIDVNVRGTILGSHTAFPYLQATPGSQVVNLCSASAIYGQPDLATYSATKFAIRGLSEALELEWGKDDIRVLALWPLFVQTAMANDVHTGTTASLGVHLVAADVADAIYQSTHHRRRRRLSKVHYPVGKQATALMAGAQFAPAWANRLMNKILSKR